MAALEGSYASVIGGAPAAAVVFAREVDRRARKDPRLADIHDPKRWEERFQAIHAETLGRVAEEFDRAHSIQRAQAVGSVHEIIAPASLRPYLIGAIERGIERERARH